MTPFRKVAISVSVIIYLVALSVMLFLGPLKVIESVRNKHLIFVSTILVTSAIFSAEIILELLRVAVPIGKTWTEKRHFAVVGAISLVLFIISFAGGYYWK